MWAMIYQKPLTGSENIWGKGAHAHSTEILKRSLGWTKTLFRHMNEHVPTLRYSNYKCVGWRKNYLKSLFFVFWSISIQRFGSSFTRCGNIPVLSSRIIKLSYKKVISRIPSSLSEPDCLKVFFDTTSISNTYKEEFNSVWGRCISQILCYMPSYFALNFAKIWIRISFCHFRSVSYLWW